MERTKGVVKEQKPDLHHWEHPEVTLLVVVEGVQLLLQSLFLTVAPQFYLTVQRSL